jgi:hypothetical protein
MRYALRPSRHEFQTMLMTKLKGRFLIIDEGQTEKDVSCALSARDP